MGDEIKPAPEIGDLSDSLLLRCIEAARAASLAAYCPYSKFPVGAAVIAEDGTIFSGCNVENASYGMTICAERNAIFRGVTSGLKRIRAVVVYTPSPKPTAPCGACRQVINEFGPHAEVISICDGAGRRRWRLPDLLADAFGPDELHFSRK